MSMKGEFKRVNVRMCVREIKRESRSECVSENDYNMDHCALM